MDNKKNLDNIRAEIYDILLDTALPSSTCADVSSMVMDVVKPELKRAYDDGQRFILNRILESLQLPLNDVGLEILVNKLC